MTQTIPFDPEHPYRLSESEHDSLCAVRSTLAVLASLCGMAGGAEDHRELEFTAHELHETLWSLHRGVEATLKAIHQHDQQATPRPAAPPQAADAPKSRDATPQENAIARLVLRELQPWAQVELVQRGVHWLHHVLIESRPSHPHQQRSAA